MRGKRISDDEIKKFIQSESERHKSRNQIIRDLRAKGFGVRKQRFLKLYKEVQSKNKNVYYIKPSNKYVRKNKSIKKKYKRSVRKKSRKQIKEIINKKEKRKIRKITADKEFTSWVRKENIELDVRDRRGLYINDYMAYLGSSQTVRECSGGNCFEIIKNKYMKKGIMTHYDFLKLLDMARELSYDSPITVKIYNKRTKALEYHSMFIEGQETNYLNLNRGLFY